ncbi:MAG: hypothetical protein M3083_09665 [Actinomycetota bacterium]|nr:hypothetical protein [Actinomycetota bacterium]
MTTGKAASLRAATFDVGPTSCSEWLDAYSPSLSFDQALAHQGKGRPLFDIPLWLSTRDFSEVNRLIKSGLLYADEVQLSSLPLTAILLRRVSPDAMETFPASLAILRDDLTQCLEAAKRRSSALAPLRSATSRAISAIDDLRDAFTFGKILISRPNPGPRVDLMIIDWLEGGMGIRRASRVVPLLSEREAAGWLAHDGSALSGRFPIPDSLFNEPESSRRMIEGMVASRLLGDLPAFPDAPLDLVLKLREALADERPQFAATVIAISKKVTEGIRSGENPSDLLDEVERTDVLPALAELHRESSAFGAIDALLRASDLKTLTATAAIVVAVGAFARLGGLSHGIDGLAAAAPLFATAAKETLIQRQGRRALRAKPFWMLREIDRRTVGRGRIGNLAERSA